MTIPESVNRYAEREEYTRDLDARVARGIAESVQRHVRRVVRNDAHARIVGLGGGVYVPGMLGDLVLFNSPATGSTLALPASQLTPDAVRAHIAESNARFGVAL